MKNHCNGLKFVCNGPNFYRNGLKIHIDELKIHIDGLLIWGNIRSLGSPTPTTVTPTPPQHSSHSRSSLLFTFVITLSSSFVIASRVYLPHPLASPTLLTLFIHISSPLFISFITLSSSQTLSLLCTLLFTPQCTLLPSQVVSDSTIIPSIKSKPLVHRSKHPIYHIPYTLYTTLYTLYLALYRVQVFLLVPYIGYTSTYVIPYIGCTYTAHIHFGSLYRVYALMYGPIYASIYALLTII